MGIKGLNTFIKKICPECITEKKITEYKNKRFAIDASILLYKYIHISNINDNCKNAHIIGFLNRIKMYQNNNIKPIFVFDGVPPIEKREILKKRQQAKKKINDKIELLNKLSEETKNEEEKNTIIAEINKLNGQLIYVTKDHIDDCKYVLDLLNIEYYDAPDEAEKYCVYLYKLNKVDYIISDDTDVFAFGGYNIIKSTMKNSLIEYDLNLLLDKLGYSFEKFIDFCILSGCDYLQYIPSLAINTVYSLFKKYNKIEDIINLKKYNFPENYNFVKVRSIFLEYNYEIPYEKTYEKINYDKIIEFLEKKEIKNPTKYLKKI